MHSWPDDEMPLPRQRPLSPPSAPQLAILYALTNFPRLLLLAYLPVSAIQQLQDARLVSALFLWSSLGAAAASVGVPKLVHRVSRRLAYLVITAVSVLAFATLSVGSPFFLFIGLFLFVAAAAANEILLNLFALENLSRSHQSRYEPLRVTFSVVGFICAPAIGVAVGTWVSPRLPYGIAMFTTLAGIAFFFSTSLKPAAKLTRPMPNPSQYLRRFFKQPRLRLAYILAFGRAAWWQMFFVYSPILVLQMGYSAKLAGFISSIALGTTISVPIWARLAKAIGVRHIVTLGFAAGAMGMIIAAVCGTWPLAVLIVLVATAFVMSSLDSVGNVFFLRAVHPYERVEMAAVFSTYRDASQAIAPMIVGPLLGFFDILTIFGIWGSLMFGLAIMSRYLPRTLR